MKTVKFGNRNYTQLIDIDVKGSKVVNGVRFYTYEQAKIAAKKFNTANTDGHLYEIPTDEDFEEADRYYRRKRTSAFPLESTWGNPGSFGCGFRASRSEIKLFGSISYNANCSMLWTSTSAFGGNSQYVMHFNNFPGEAPHEFLLPLVLIQR